MNWGASGLNVLRSTVGSRSFSLTWNTGFAPANKAGASAVVNLAEVVLLDAAAGGGICVGLNWNAGLTAAVVAGAETDGEATCAGVVTVLSKQSVDTRRAGALDAVLGFKENTDGAIALATAGGTAVVVKSLNWNAGLADAVD